MTTVYMLRHSKPFRRLLGEYNANEVEQIRNEKNILSVEGEMLAEEISNYKELQNIDTLYSSHYVRAMSTAKYIAENNDIPLNVDERLGERKFGVNDISKLPKDYFEEQFRNWNYKLETGESVHDTYLRMNKALKEILNKNRDKKICIVSHGTAISAMLKKWCKIKINKNNKALEIYFKNKLVFDGKWRCPELFRLDFDENNNLINIINIRKY